MVIGCADVRKKPIQKADSKADKASMRLSTDDYLKLVGILW